LAEQIVGTWRLRVWEQETSDGTISYPVGADALGYLAYTPDGFLFVTIMRPNRPNFATDGLFSGTDQEKAQAASTFFAYSGHYEVQEGRAIHHIELSLFPNWSGTVQERPLELLGDQLTITVVQELSTGTATQRLIWDRANVTASSR